MASYADFIFLNGSNEKIFCFNYWACGKGIQQNTRLNEANWSHDEFFSFIDKLKTVNYFLFIESLILYSQIGNDRHFLNVS